MRVICPCSAVVEIIDDGRSYEVAAECPECVSNGGQYNKSSAWHESDRDVSQLDKLGKYKPAALEEKWPAKKQREPHDKEPKRQGGQSGREQQTPRPSSQSKRQGRKQHR
jgi:hypothetical protein